MWLDVTLFFWWQGENLSSHGVHVSPRESGSCRSEHWSSCGSNTEKEDVPRGAKKNDCLTEISFQSRDSVTGGSEVEDEENPRDGSQVRGDSAPRHDTGVDPRPPPVGNWKEYSKVGAV